MNKQKAEEKASVKLLSGDNPQIAKGFGNEPVAAYIEAVPGWKQAIVREIDDTIVAAVPAVQKAVKWNTPLYGLDGTTWFASVHCFKNFVRLTFFRGTDLEPLPAGPSKVAGVRYHDVEEAAGLDRPLLTQWIRQASALPGEKM